MIRVAFPGFLHTSTRVVVQVTESHQDHSSFTITLGVFGNHDLERITMVVSEQESESESESESGHSFYAIEQLTFDGPNLVLSLNRTTEAEYVQTQQPPAAERSQAVAFLQEEYGARSREISEGGENRNGEDESLSALMQQHPEPSAPPSEQDRPEPGLWRGPGLPDPNQLGNVPPPPYSLYPHGASGLDGSKR
ncbi:hypothetical protein NX722_07485 [Endozoicomonas gorgoniicola]|uniref:Uncharacterized protein n=1 Tax=Endozoicomonas gorgoniicola TaxID=1234144 RepID=A0ABT3MSX6_9GAMM|nr:hypothetical protein [Endozoicomonas gorgoniicola]MCW7552489.1 hypothetical protein [Endozoicomonas gorgoniicola]